VINNILLCKFGQVLLLNSILDYIMFNLAYIEKHLSSEPFRGLYNDFSVCELFRGIRLWLSLIVDGNPIWLHQTLDPILNHQNVSDASTFLGISVSRGNMPFSTTQCRLRPNGSRRRLVRVQTAAYPPHLLMP
jgi:hypothetical protein